MNNFFSLTEEQKEKVISKFKSFFVEGEKKECWIWTGTKWHYGYGRLSIKSLGIEIRAHRFSWMLRYGMPIPKDLFCCHTCDVPSCVNPSHLKIADARENSMDAVIRGRWRSKHDGKPQRPIEERIVIAREFLNGLLGKALKEKYGVTGCTVKQWLRKKDFEKRFGKLPSLMHRKGKHSGVSFEEKLKAVKEFIAGETAQSLAKKYNVTDSAVHHWKRHPQIVSILGIHDLSKRTVKNLVGWKRKNEKIKETSEQLSLDSIYVGTN